MKKSKKIFWTGWNKEAAAHFGEKPCTITMWRKAEDKSLDILIKHNKLMDWVFKQLTDVHSVPSDIAKEIVDNNRVGFEKCLEK